MILTRISSKLVVQRDFTFSTMKTEKDQLTEISKNTIFPDN